MLNPEINEVMKNLTYPIPALQNRIIGVLTFLN